METSTALQNTTNDSQAIEVEVLEVDGVTVPTRTRPEENSGHPSRNSSWKQWQGQVKRLDARWWPLWVIVGILAISLLLTVGLVIGVIFLVFRIIAGGARAIFG